MNYTPVLSTKGAENCQGAKNPRTLRSTQKRRRSKHTTFSITSNREDLGGFNASATTLVTTASPEPLRCLCVTQASGSLEQFWCSEADVESVIALFQERWRIVQRYSRLAPNGLREAVATQGDRSIWEGRKLLVVLRAPESGEGDLEVIRLNESTRVSPPLLSECSVEVPAAKTPDESAKTLETIETKPPTHEAIHESAALAWIRLYEQATVAYLDLKKQDELQGGDLFEPVCYEMFAHWRHAQESLTNAILMLHLGAIPEKAVKEQAWAKSPVGPPYGVIYEDNLYLAINEHEFREEQAEWGAESVNERLSSLRQIDGDPSRLLAVIPLAHIARIGRED